MFRKRRAKPSSVNLYCRLRRQYNLRLACDMCIRTNDDRHTCGLKTINHNCTQNRLLLLAKNRHTTDSGDLLRIRRADYDPVKTVRICEHVELDEQCLEKHWCPYPHTDVERDMWKQDYSGNISIARLVRDRRESSLKLSVEVKNLTKVFNGTFKLICAVCYQESSEVVTKRRHVPECMGPGLHPWTDKEVKKLVFEMALDRRLIHCDNVNTCQHVSEEEQELVRRVRSLINDVGLTVDDIADEAARLRQADRSAILLASRNATYVEDKHEPYYPESDDDDNTDEYLAKTAEKIFDNDANDLLNDAVFGEDAGDSEDKHSVRWSHTKSDYYEMLTEEQTQDDSDVAYGCGKIKLIRAFNGTCKIVSGKMKGCEVELRGRVNCGPAFDGDEVQVKVYLKNVKEDNSEKLFGTVVNVTKRSVHRTARTFVCKVGQHNGNLMTPLCETVPKFHIIDTCLLKRYGPRKKGNYVAVYNNDLSLRKTVKLDQRRRKEMVFVVKYLKWENKYKYPLGYVCRILREYGTAKDSQKILNLMYELPFYEETELNVTADELEEQEDIEREDMCKLLTVSIDHPCTKEVDDALSLEEYDGKFVVWIHIADVTHYVRKGDCNDENAQKRMLSYYSPVPRWKCHDPMLPKEFAENKCSLLQNMRRRALSVRFELTDKGKVLYSTEPKASWILNDKQLSYKDVQTIIDRVPGVFSTSRAIDQMLLSLHKMATVLRKGRMNEGSHYYEYNREHYFSNGGIDDPFDFDQNQDAHRLVEEFMILTNQHVGKMLRQNFPHCTPFLVQKAPDDDSRETWKTDHGCVIPFSFCLKQHQELLEISRKNRAVTPLTMLPNCWDAMKVAVKEQNEQNVRKVRTIIGSEQLHPLHSIALSSWFAIQEHKHYACNDSNGLHDMRHFSLQTCDYVHFTSPLRRYVDVIVHRLVKAKVSELEPPPYTQDEVEKLCEKMNAHKSRKRLYDQSCGLLMMAMLQKPIFMPCYVESFNDFSIQLASPYFQTDSCRLKFNEMTVHDNPMTPSRSGGKVTLNWSKRYYDTLESRTPHARSDSNTTHVLDPGMFGKTVCQSVWLSLHEAVNDQTGNLLARVSKAMRANNPMQQQRETVREVTSEMAGNKPLVRNLVRFSCDITRGTVLSDQFTAKISEGILQPVVRLVSLTHDKNICIEHQRDPVHVFVASVATKKVKHTYQAIEEYQNIWLPILNMEAATNAVRNNESIVCSHVPVIFFIRNENVYGTLQLKKDFCAKRYISLLSVSDEDTHDYMCIRHFLVEPTAKSFSRSIWVAHATVVCCNCTSDDIKLTVKCKCTVSESPKELFSGRNVKCTVEFLLRALPDK